MNNYQLADLSISLSESFKEKITLEMIRSFTQLSGDSNPLHNDLEYAKELGHKDIVAHGMLTSSLVSRLVGVQLPGKYALLQGVKISFHQPVYPQDTLEIVGEVSYINEALKQIELKIKIHNQDGIKVAKGKANVGLLK